MQGYVPYIIIQKLDEDRRAHLHRHFRLYEWDASSRHKTQGRIRLGSALIRLGRWIEGADHVPAASATPA